MLFELWEVQKKFGSTCNCIEERKYQGKFEGLDFLKYYQTA